MSADQTASSQEAGRALNPTIADSIATIKTSALRFFSGTMLSRITGMLRDMVLAFCFGTHEAVAALFVAFRLSHVCRRLFGEGAMQAAFIPFFEDLRKDTPVKAFRFFRDLSCLMTLFLICFIIASMLVLFVSPYFIDWSPGNLQIVELATIFMPSLLFICLFGINSSLLQCQKRYFTVGIAPAFFNICISLGSLLFIGVNPNEAMPYVAVFVVFGCMFQWLITFGPTLKTVKQSIDAPLFSNIQLLSPDIKRFAKPLALGMLGVGSSILNNAVDAFFARWADLEGPAQMWYALRLLQLPLALFGIVISGAILPPLSRSIQAGRKEEYLKFLDFALRRVFAFLMPCTIALYVLGIPIINLIFGRGDFQLHSILTTCVTLHGYAMGLIPMGLIIVLAPAFYAYKDFKTPTKGAVLALCLNMILNCIFIFGLGMQVFSVALATSISSWVNILYLYHHLKKHFGQVVSGQGKFELSKLTIVSMVAGALVWFFQSAFFLTPTLFYWFTDLQAGISNILFEQCIAFGVPAVVYMLLLFGLAWVVKAQDLLVLFRLKKE